MERDAAHSYTAAAYFNEGQHFHGKEIGPGEHAPVRPDESLPGRRSTPLGRWSDIMPTEDVADRSIRDRLAQIRQRAHHPVISPATVFARQADHQRFQLR